MLNVSPDIESEIQKRIASSAYATADDLLRVALRALDDSQDWLEEELLNGFEGADVEMTRQEWANLRREAEREAGVARSE